MFKKLKDKLAEEVKSSPQRIQQFAQAAQAAVTSASSSISDITNNDLFSIGDNDGQQNRQVQNQTSPRTPKNTFQDVSLAQSPSLQASTDSMEYMSSQDITDNQRQRKLSNSSFASDVSFRLPSYESPSTYHLQSDMEVSASEADERGLSGGPVSLERITKEQIYAAYKRTQERYTKYRTQYADLARHYKLLERENAKARSVLVETQDKALRRISELREQCSLEQSAKAHLEKALRVEMEEKNIVIDSLKTKIQFLQTSNDEGLNAKSQSSSTIDNDVQLITLSTDNGNKQLNNDMTSEITILNNKIEKLEQLVNKYKDSLKMSKEKNAQLAAELQLVTSDLENKSKENDQLKAATEKLTEARQDILKLNDLNEELQNKVNTYEFAKQKEMSSLELDVQKYLEEIAELQSKIEVFNKREEEYAISLAENKLSIHKELESKETEIKSLKDSLTAAKNEIQSFNIIINDYKNSISLLEEDRTKLVNDSKELEAVKSKITGLESQIHTLTQKCQALENSNLKAEEEYKCLQLQLTQETAEKLAMVDRNAYLENRNSQLSEENARKTSQISAVENELQILQSNQQGESSASMKIVEEVNMWKKKCSSLESEIQEEREELVKLQSEIERLLANCELIQTQNTELHRSVSDLKAEKVELLENVSKLKKVKSACEILLHQVRNIRPIISSTSDEVRHFRKNSNNLINNIEGQITTLLNQMSQRKDKTDNIKALYEHLEDKYKSSRDKIKTMAEELEKSSAEIVSLKEENDKLNSKVKTNEAENSASKEDFNKANNKYKILLKEHKLLKTEEQNLLQKIDETESKCHQLQKAIETEKQQNVVVTNQVEALEQDNQNLIKKLKTIEEEHLVLNTERDQLQEELTNSITQLASMKLEHDLLIIKTKEVGDKVGYMNELENKVKAITDENFSLKNQYDKIKSDTLLELSDKTKEIETKNQFIKNLEEKISFLKQENSQSKKVDSDALLNKAKELEDKSQYIEKLKHEIEAVTQENQGLKYITKEMEDKKQYINKLEDKTKLLTEENISLKGQSEKISNSLRDLEIELCEVRKSHTEIESEKDRLNIIIEELEKNDFENARSEGCHRHTQTDAFDKENESIELRQEIKVLSDLNSELSKKLPQETLDSYKQQYESLKDQFESLKEENKRLESDVSGLQSYLTQISKENSVLNDKMRELIASSEFFPNNGSHTISHDLSEFKGDNRLKEKYDDLMRENTLLVEENLELKDQLNSQNYKPVKSLTSDYDKDYSNLKEKYNNLIESKHLLEKKLYDLENMNKSSDDNVLLLQQNNEKLRLSNDKLGRRLDEALVSLRHLHSLQENTELEYLRNILYEYLTGSGTHSVTLAKVLSAVVKFDETQTHNVLQKEKERQGFLKQLGLI